MPSFTRSWFLALSAILILSARATAQESTVVQVHVVDTTQTPVADVEVSIVRGLTNVVAKGRTGTQGLVTLRFSGTSGDYEVVARRIGYERSSRYVRAWQADSLAIEVVMPRIAQRLEGVNVQSQQDRWHKTQFIDADAIAQTSRPLFTAVDIILKLRPGMVWGRIDAARIPGCRPASQIWINGQHIVGALPDLDAVGDSWHDMQSNRSRRSMAGGGSGSASGIAPDVVTVLKSIQPEHIQSMEYHDCVDLSVVSAESDRLYTHSALFVTLKPGVEFELGVGSYVMDAPLDSLTDEPNSAALREQAQGRLVATTMINAAIDEAAARAANSHTVSNPGSVVVGGVITLDSLWWPVAGAEVILEQTGLSTRADSTGAFLLTGIPAGVYIMTVRAIGYQVGHYAMAPSGTDTLAYAIQLARMGMGLPTVHVIAAATLARNPAMAARLSRARLTGLLLEGKRLDLFPGPLTSTLRGEGIRIDYDKSGTAIPMSSRSSGSSAIDPKTGNAVSPGCAMGIWLDGQPANGFSLDAIQTIDVVAVEIYTAIARIPPEYNTAGMNASCGVVAIWTSARLHIDR